MRRRGRCELGSRILLTWRLRLARLRHDTMASKLNQHACLARETFITIFPG